MRDESEYSTARATITAAVIGAGGMVVSVMTVCATALIVVWYVYGG